MNTQKGFKLNEELITASACGNLELVKNLIKKGADIHASDDMPLIEAAAFGFLLVVKYLIENGADIHAQDDNALKNASGSGYINVVNYLIEKGANISAGNNEVLSRAVLFNRLEMVKNLIIEHGCNPQFALKEARKKNQLTIIKWCEDYIVAKDLNDKLEGDLFVNNKKEKKIKI